MKVWDFKDKHSNWIKVSTNDANVFRVQVYRCDVVVGLVSNLKNKHQHLISTLHWNRNNNVVVFNIKLIILYVTVKNSLLSKFKYVNQRWKKDKTADWGGDFLVMVHHVWKQAVNVLTVEYTTVHPHTPKKVDDLTLIRVLSTVCNCHWKCTFQFNCKNKSIYMYIKKTTFRECIKYCQKKNPNSILISLAWKKTTNFVYFFPLWE